MRRAIAVVLTAIMLPLLASAADSPSTSQRKMAVGLAVAHVRAESRRFPQTALPGIDFDHPQVVTRRARGGRRLVFVSFDSKLPKWGEYVTFEVCAHSSKVVRIAAGRLSDLGLYRSMLAKGDATTPNNLPSGCSGAGG